MWSQLLRANHLANRRLDRRFLLVAFVVFWPWAGWRLVKLAWRFRISTAVAVSVLVVWATWGLWALAVGVAVVAGVPLGLGLVCSPRVRSAVVTLARSGWRRWGVYRPRWSSLMTRHGLADRQAGTVAELRSVVSTPEVDTVTAGIPRGLSPGDFRDAAEGLAHATRAESCTVRVTRPGEVALYLRRRDPLDRPIGLPGIPAAPDLRAVPVGTCEDRSVWPLPVLGSHLLCAGITGSGKGSVLWSLVRGLAPAIQAGLVRVTGIDPKGGMELAFGANLFDWFVFGSWDEMATALEDKAEAMSDRTSRLRGVTRQHEPTVEDPLELIVVDELLDLAALSPRKVQARVEDAVSRLLSQGRAPGFTLAGFTQEVTKDVLPFRDLFPTRVALRLATSNQVDMVLGDGSYDQGAVCDRIPASMPGTGYVRVEGVAEPARVRAGFVSDEQIHALARDYTPTARGARSDAAGASA